MRHLLTWFLQWCLGIFSQHSGVQLNTFLLNCWLLCICYWPFVILCHFPIFSHGVWPGLFPSNLKNLRRRTVFLWQHRGQPTSHDRWSGDLRQARLGRGMVKSWLKSWPPYLWGWSSTHENCESYDEHLWTILPYIAIIWQYIFSWGIPFTMLGWFLFCVMDFQWFLHPMSSARTRTRRTHRQESF